MTNIIQNTRIEICAIDIYAPPLRVLRQREFCRELAKFYDELGLSGPATLYWLQTILFDKHSGRLFGSDGKEMDVKNDPSFTDDAFGEDERRSILRFRERSSKQFKNLLQVRMIETVTLLHFGREIHMDISPIDLTTR